VSRLKWIPLVSDRDDFSSGQVKKGGLFIGLEVHPLKNILEFDP
jgi:hypothetical protein